LTIENLETSWQEQWLGSETILRKETSKFNHLLKKNKSSSRLYLRFIDAVDLNRLEEISDKFEKIFLITEQNLTILPDNVELCKLPTEFYGCYYSKQIPNSRSIEKDFNCFINRLDPIRQSWFYLLYDRKLLDRGYVSFNAKLRAGQEYPGDKYQEVVESYHRDYLSSFDNIKDKITSMIPFKNFIDNNDLFSTTLATKFSIILETYPERTDAKVFSEKIFRSLQLPRPWLLFAATGCVGQLRSIGFDVYDDIVDHGYDLFDTECSTVDRQESILAQTKDLVNLKMTPALLDRLQQGADHNRKLLCNWYSNWRQLCLTHIQETFVKAMEHNR
jgi:hypothetical protein